MQFDKYDVSYIVGKCLIYVYDQGWKYEMYVKNDPHKIACFQNVYLSDIEINRNEGPTYPIDLVDSFATLIYMRDCGINNESVIDCPPSELPDNYPECLPDQNLLPM